MALIHAPEVLFLDEPTTGLDPTSRTTLWDEVRRLRDEGTTVFLTTQYLEEADQLADRVGIIDDGRLVAEGTPAALKAEVGSPHLDITLVDLDGDLDAEAAARAVAPFGELCATAPGVHDSLRVADGAAAMAPVVRALDEAGLAVEGIELVRPTLDDVFAEKTGHRLEGAVPGAAPTVVA
jgi:ABC-2 type transport system ATP-binding protein